MSEHTTAEECDICAACRRHGVTDDTAIEYFHKYVELQETMVSLIADAEDSGVDLDLPVYTKMSDELFGADDDHMKMN